MLMRLLIALAATASAATIKINVGQGGLTFTPDSVTAAVGDVLEFKFVGGNHDAVAGDFARPCQPAATPGFASGNITGSPTNVSNYHLLCFNLKSCFCCK
jgi:plastocyanin